MIYEEACRIMSMSGTETKPEIKKRYRKLMQQVHPDALGGQESSCGYAAWEINAAYEILMNMSSQAHKKETTSNDNTHKTGNRWHAPINENAYMERDIYVDGICVESGKYYYTKEEGFPMFLRSIYHCSKKILCRFHETAIQRYLGETAYLLSQQFVSRETILERYKTEEGTKGNIYYFPAMLETEGKRYALRPGTTLVPGGVRNHRLYLNDTAGREMGYISFHDDLVYYALVPLFEQRKAEIKARISGNTLGNNNKRAVKVRTVDLWVRIAACNWTQIEIQLSDQIAALVRRCEEEEQEF